jgi:cation-transporting ATPase I
VAWLPSWAGLGSVASGVLAGPPGRRRRRIHVRDGHAEIEVRGLHRRGTEAVADELEAALARLEGVHWAEVNAVLGRVVVAFDGDGIDPDALVEVVEGLEEARELHTERFPADRADHPADAEALHHQLTALAADAAGTALGTAGRLLGAGPVPGYVAGLLSLADSSPGVHRLLDARLGPAVADLGLALGNATAQALGQSPLATVVDAVHRTSLVTEVRARRRVWDERAPELFAPPRGARARPVPPVPRPAPLPAGPVERYADASAATALAAAGAALLLTRDPRRAEIVLAAATPKAARLTREAYAAQLDRLAAARGVVTMDPRALRRLDRIDTVVVDAAVLHTGRYVVGELRALDPGADEARFRRRALALLDPAAPVAVRRRGKWALGPPRESDGLAPGRLRGLRRPGGHVLVLCREGQPVAVVAVDPEPDPLAGALLAAAGRAGELVIAGRGSGLGARLGCRSVPGGTRLADAVRDLQRDGRGVALVAARGGAALAAADCGIGVLTDAHPVPWGAHVLAGPGLAEVHLLLGAVAAARTVSRRGARVALGGSVTAALLALAMPGAGARERAQLGVHGAALAGIAAGAWTAYGVARHGVAAPLPSAPWHAMTAKTALRRLGTSAEGLSEPEAASRRADRPRAEEDEPTGVVGATVDELANPLSPALATGAGLAALTGSVLDAALITSVMGLNAFIGGVQRIGAERAVRKLSDATALRVLLRRGGHEVETTADEVVPGDVVVLYAGDAVPADCRILEARAVEVDEASLTGESQLVAKTAKPSGATAVAERASMLYAGTSLAAGSAVGVVVATGPDTESGRSALADADGPKPPSGIQARLQSLTRKTLPVSVVAGAALLGAGALRGRPLRATLAEGVGLAVAAVPEGLPIVATVAQLGAARRLSRRGALVRNVSTVEALGRVDVLCFDKTGTLTEGRLALHQVRTRHGVEPVTGLSAEGREVLATGLRASPLPRGGHVLPHPTDQAVVDGAVGAGVTTAAGNGAWEPVDDVPFEPARGYHAALGRTASGHRIAVKGAPEVIVPRCVSWRAEGGTRPLDDAGRAALEADVDRLARSGHRVLAVADRAASGRADLTDERVSGLTFRGLLALADPVRPTAAAAVATVQRAGVDVVMVTGDHPSTAEAIAAELGVLDGRRVMTGPELDAVPPGELAAVLPTVSVFARVTPEHKARIVAALQAAGHVVAVTGDGANDAPAIRRADVGVALGVRATPAAREAADVVVADDRIETIIDAIIEGRALCASVRDAVAMLLGGNLGEIAFTLGAGVFTPTGSPLNARQLLLVNLLTDILPAMALALRPPPHATPERLLREGPDVSLGTALTRDVALRAVTTATAATGGWLVGRVTGTRRHAGTVALVALVGSQLGQTAAAGWRSPLVLGSSVASAAVLAGIVQTPGVSRFFGCTPLGPVGWGAGLSAAAAATGAALLLPAGTGLLTPHLDAADRRR